jgi:hypothetical protein
MGVSFSVERNPIWHISQKVPWLCSAAVCGSPKTIGIAGYLTQRKCCLHPKWVKEQDQHLLLPMLCSDNTFPLLLLLVCQVVLHADALWAGRGLWEGSARICSNSIDPLLCVWLSLPFWESLKAK